MRFQTLVACLFCATAVSAIPTKATTKDQVDNDNGTVKITFSDDEVILDKDTAEYIMENVIDMCASQTDCTALESSLKELDHITYSMPANTTFRDGLDEDLKKALGAAVEAATDCSDASHCVVPRYWGIDYQTANSSDAASPRIAVDLQRTDEVVGYCAAFAAVAGVIGDAVENTTAGVFVVGGFACIQ